MMTQENYVNINDLHKQGWTIQEIAEATRGWSHVSADCRLEGSGDPECTVVGCFVGVESV